MDFKLKILYKEKKFEESAKVLRRHGGADAIEQLGVMYVDGLVGRKNGQQIMKQPLYAIWKQKKNPVAITNLGGLYYEGRIGTKDGRKDYEKAGECFKTANTSEAQYYLNTLQLAGAIGAKDDR